MTGVQINQILLLILVVLNAIKLALDLHDRRERRRAARDNRHSRAA